MKNRLTIKKLEKLYDDTFLYNNKSWIIPAWKIPLLWTLWFFIGYSIISENWKMYWVDFRGVKYLIKSEVLGEDRSNI